MISYYKNGVKTGKWQIFNKKTGKLYHNIQFNVNSNCSDKYIQEVDTVFNPLIKLSQRFEVSYEEAEVDESCSKITEDSQADFMEYPFSFFRLRISTMGEGAPKKNIYINEMVDYSSISYLSNCDKSIDYGQTTVCKEKRDNTLYIKYISADKSTLLRIVDSIVPQKNEIYFFYQQMKTKTYNTEEEDYIRYLHFKMDNSIKSAVNNELFTTDYILNNMLHDLWKTPLFPKKDIEKALLKALE